MSEQFTVQELETRLQGLRIQRDNFRKTVRQAADNIQAALDAGRDATPWSNQYNILRRCLDASDQLVTACEAEVAAVRQAMEQE